VRCRRRESRQNTSKAWGLCDSPLERGGGVCPLRNVIGIKKKKMYQGFIIKYKSVFEEDKN